MVRTIGANESSMVFILDTKHLPRNLSACHGIYGSPPEYMGTYYMHEDYNIWGISHVPVSGGVSTKSKI